jgi:DNA modification methylase
MSLQLSLFDDEQIKEIEVEYNVPSRAKLGDIWQLGEHRLMCGDSTDAETVAKLMNGKKADMVFTDPPYGVKYSARTNACSGKIRPEMQMILNDDLGGAELQNFINVIIYNLKLYSKNNAPFYICNNWHCFETFIDAFKVNNLVLNAFIIWHKDWLSVGHSDYRSNHEFIFYSKRDGEFYAPKGVEHDVWTIRKLSPDKKIHTTEKPTKVSARAIKNSSKQNDIVLDLFGGSGSTLIACEQLKRICYMMELDPKYCDVIINRWEKYTGQKAVLLNE